MPAPAISILIPAHNAAPWIEACVASALAQTLPPLEVLVWEDGSTDATPAILKTFGEKIRVLGGKNIGSNPGRNRLLAEARGDWVQFLDADDALLPDKLALQWAETPAPDNTDVIYSPTLDETWEGTQRLVSRVTSEVDPKRDLFEQWFLWQLSQTNGSLWRRMALTRLGGWNEAQSCCQDNELYARALRAGLRFHFAPNARAIHRAWSEQSVSRRNPAKVLQEKTRLIDEMVGWMRSRAVLERRHLEAAGRACFEIARTLARSDLPAASAYLRQRREHFAVRPSGPAAPMSYRLAYYLLGFGAAEKLARHLR
ncbi:MAG TPA: glycosyltransferase [Opitutaceae bacterium]|nr:glycosyltransferase [Opitutaceae bacterium]